MSTPKSSHTYHKIKDIIFYAGLVLDVILLIVFLTSGLSASLRNLAFQTSSNTIVANGIYVLTVYLVLYFVHFPLKYFSGFVWEHQFDLSNQTAGQWLRDECKQAVLSCAIFLFVIEVIYQLLAILSDAWWIGAGIFWLFLTIVLARITPQLIVPLFFKYGDIEDQDLKTRIKDLFSKCRVKIKDVYSIDFSKKTKKANAFVCGLGNSRRVVLSDTLISNFSADEIEAVVAHELGHYKHHDILKITLIHSIIVFVGFFLIDKVLSASGVTRIDDITYFPMMALFFMAFSLMTSPILNGISRVLEVKADRFSLELTKKPKDFISMIRKLGEMNLAEMTPNRFKEIMFYDHPPIPKRIKMAEAFLPPNRYA